MNKRIISENAVQKTPATINVTTCPILVINPPLTPKLINNDTNAAK